MKRLAILLLPALMITASCQQNSEPVKEEVESVEMLSPCDPPGLTQSEIRADVLGVYEAAFEKYNDGDFMGYMDMFWKSDSLRTIMYDKSFYGWQNIIDTQLRTDPNFESLGTVTRLEIKVDVISENAAIIFDRYFIQLPKSSTYGASTSVMRYFGGKWQIVHSHISTATN